MPCIGDGTVGTQTQPWLFLNWAGTRQISVSTQDKPADVRQLVAAIQEVERAGGSAKAVGSAWSYTDAAVDESVTHAIDISALNANLTGGDPTVPDNVIPFALKTALRPTPDATTTRHFVHVEAGITIYDLNFLLDGLTPKLAMPTLGGSNGQSLAGAISTGTHGADINLPPIADHVKAIHLVGPGGQEWWLEQTGPASITDPVRLARARDAERLCSDIRIAYDDQLFRAALVSLGRMGVIYSVVVEVVPAFRLEQTRVGSKWSTEAAWIRTNVMTAGGGNTADRAKEFVINPYADTDGDHDCVVTTRNPTQSFPNQAAPSPDLFGMLCNSASIDAVLLSFSAVVTGLIITATAEAIAGLSWLLAIPIVGAMIFASLVTGAITAATTSLLGLQTAVLATLGGGQTVADKLVRVCNLATSLGLKQLVRDLVVAFTIQQRPADPPGASPVVNDGFRLMTSQMAIAGVPRTPDPPCLRAVDGLEFAFPATAGQNSLFDFMNDVFALTDEFYNTNMPMGFGISIRITSGTTALIGMQQFARTAHVEFLFIRGLTGQNDFYNRLHDIAAQRGGIPHWGLIHSLDQARVDAIYGNNVVQWRQALARIVAGGSGRTTTFRTRFSIDRTLEPASEIGGQDFYAAIWEQRQGAAWVARHGMSSAQYQQTFDDLVAQGYRLVQVSGYGIGGQDFYAAIWEQRPGPVWVARHGMSSAQYQQTFDDLVAQGYRLVQVSGYGIGGGQDFYAAIWEQQPGPVWVARHGMSSAQYQQTFDDLVAQGYRLVQVSGYGIGGQDFYAAIWEQRQGPAWVARHGMSSAQYQQTFDDLVAQGYRLVQVSGYSTT